MIIGEADRSLLDLLASRLGRLSADSRWAHRASGLRGQVLRLLDQLESSEQIDEAQFQILIETGFFILREAARELRGSGLTE